MEFRILGDPDGGPSLDLDHERFAYAGKFVMGGTGKATVRDDGAIVAAAAFDRDRTDPTVIRIRYVTVRTDRRGAGVGAALIAFTADRVLEEATGVCIAVNNPFAYQAAYKAGFGYLGRQTGIAELVLRRPDDRSAVSYRRGLEVFRDRPDLSDAERSFLAGLGETPPPTVDPHVTA